MTLFNKAALEHEERIVWLVEDLSQYPWVRSSVADFTDRKKIAKSWISQINKNTEVFVGYAELEDDTPPSFIDKPSGRKYFNRRIFTVKKDDYESYNNGTYPTEAVETSTVQQKIAGRSPKKKAQIAVRLPQPLMRKLETHIQRTGMSQTEIVISALANYLGSTEDLPIIDRLVLLEEKVAALEAERNGENSGSDEV